MSATERLELLYRAGDVKRLHVARTLRPYTVAEHVYGAQCIAVELCYSNPQADALAVLQTLLYHDAAEVETGDLPANVKRDVVGMRDAFERMEEAVLVRYGIPMPEGQSQLERNIVKAADILDCAWRCLVELQMGNRTPFLGVVFGRLLEYVEPLYAVQGVQGIAEYLEQQWHLAGGSVGGRQ
jgi:5'-deoxynucleotidase YfbR-like HD superfamily hydrolase